MELTGHTANNRLGALARRPAPLQLTWIGSLNSMTGWRPTIGSHDQVELSPPGRVLLNRIWPARFQTR